MPNNVFHTGRYAGVIHVPGNPEASVSSYNIEPEQSGMVFTTSGNLTSCTFYLPNASAGLEYAFMTGTSSGGTNTITIEAQSGNGIRWPFLGTSYQRMSNSAYTNGLRVRAINNTYWYTIQNFGGWSGGF